MNGNPINSRTQHELFAITLALVGHNVLAGIAKSIRNSILLQQMYQHVVCLSLCRLSHSCTLLTPMVDGMRCHLAGTLVWSQVFCIRQVSWCLLVKERFDPIFGLLIENALQYGCLFTKSSKANREHGVWDDKYLVVSDPRPTDHVTQHMRSGHFGL